MPKPKAYVIIHDGKNIAVFRGGTSGFSKEPRTGNHLPGGTMNYGETHLKTVQREMHEETGLDKNIITHPTAMPPQILNVFFVVQRVGDVAELLAPFQTGRPPGDGTDAPFTDATAVPIAECMAHGFFQKSDLTEWFGAGIEQAQNLNLFSNPASNK
jgi:ADP-ribose pyrophosphatase YjhB (NUDIX family)